MFCYLKAASTWSLNCFLPACFHTIAGHTKLFNVYAHESYHATIPLKKKYLKACLLLISFPLSHQPTYAPSTVKPCIFPSIPHQFYSSADFLDSFQPESRTMLLWSNL
eukprot:c22423_g1_i1 orf=114-437(-)